MAKDVLEDVAAAIYGHPQFDKAALHYIENILRWRHEMGRFNKVLSSYARNHIFMNVLLLHYVNKTNSPENGATFGRLLDLCLERQLCGSRFLRTVLLLATWTGYITVLDATGDKRAKLYVPTQKLIKTNQDYFSYVMGCFDIMGASNDLANRPHSDPNFLRTFLGGACQAYLDHKILMGEFFPELLVLMQRDGGLPTVLAYVEADLLRIDPPLPKDVAKRFSTSLSQVRKVIREAEGFKLMAFSTSNGAMDVTGIATIYKKFIARELSLYAKYGLGLGPYFIGAQS